MAQKPLIITLHDGHTIEVKPTLEDTLAFETTLRKNKNWGTLTENALKITPFRAWNAARRLGLIEQSWEEFSKGEFAAQGVESAPDEEEEEDDDLDVGRLGKDTRTTRSTSSSSASPSAPASAPASGSKSPDVTPA